MMMIKLQYHKFYNTDGYVHSTAARRKAKRKSLKSRTVCYTKYSRNMFINYRLYASKPTCGFPRN